MGKSADAFRTISEVAEWLGIPTHVLRFWESKFIQVKPVKRAGGRRYYRPGDMLLLGGIKKLLHEDGMTIKGVQKILRKDGIGPVAEQSQPLDDVTAAEYSETTAEASSDPVKPSTTQVSEFKSESKSPPTPTGPEDKPAAAPVAQETDAALVKPEPLAAKPAEAPSEPAKEVQDVAPSEPASVKETQDPALPGSVPKPQEADISPAKDETAIPADPAPARPPAPAKITVPDDPDDSIAAAPGLLGQLARLPRPLPPDLASKLAPVIARLHKISGTGDPANKN
ncbi:Transcriptional regulator PA2737, MerR family [hydrothermal vent metagenome]|uniref:Transcriptional regulator PA2737, MerR family n=1 Tax=hydrothermal vent metagenome TaxID=652676 RepID=A0A3B0SX65_9ZZZZ